MATVALVPLLVLTLLQYQATLRLAEQLRSTSSQAVEYDLTRVLARTVEANAAVLNEQAEVTRLALHVQALQVERRLGVGADRVANIASVSQRLYADHPGIFLNAFTVLSDGTQSAYPKRPGAATIDVRTRPWYRSARAAGKMVWSRPALSSTTNQLVITASMPIFQPDGSFAGVTAIELPIVQLLRQIDQRQAQDRSTASGASLVARMVGRVDSILVEAGAVAGGRTQRVRVLARRAYQFRTGGARASVALDWLDGSDEAKYRRLVDDVLARRAGIQRFAYQGHDSLWAYSPVSALGASVLLVLPFDRVRAAAQELDQTLSAETVREVGTSFVLVLGVVAIATVLALVTAAFASRPIRRLAEATARLGAGDMSARADVGGRDEIGQLAAAFNAMVPRLAEGMRLRGSLELARTVQQNLLALPPPQIPGFDACGLSRSCEETGGDYYDFLDLSSVRERRLAVAVGDVTGHGIAAALLMANARALLRGILHENPSLGGSVDRTNELLCADIHDGSFVTLALTVVAPDLREIRWVNAAHDPPLVFDRTRDAFLMLPGADIPLGINPEWHFAERALELEDGEVVVVIGTDGIWETESPAGEQFGRERLRELIRTHAALPAWALCRRVVEAVDAFHGPAPQTDDVTLVVIKVGIGVRQLETAAVAEGPVPRRTV